MRIKNENITIEPFTIEYTKERVEWEEKQCKKYKKATFVSSWIIMIALVAALIYAVAWTLSDTLQKLSGSFLLMVLITLLLFIVFLVVIYNEYSIEDLASISVRKLMKWNYVPHYECPTLIQKIGSIQEMWRQITKSIKEGTAQVNLSEEKEETNNCSQLVLRVKYETLDKTIKEEKFLVLTKSDDKTNEDLFSGDSLVISFYDVKKDWLPFRQNKYVYVSKNLHNCHCVV